MTVCTSRTKIAQIYNYAGIRNRAYINLTHSCYLSTLDVILSISYSALTSSMDASSGYNHKHKWFAVNSAFPNANVAMSNGHNEPPQFWLNHQVSQQVSVPHKSLIGPLVQWKLGEVWFGLCEMVLPLMTVREVIAMRVVESRGSKYTLNHSQILLVGSILGICSRK